MAYIIVKRPYGSHFNFFRATRIGDHFFVSLNDGREEGLIIHEEYLWKLFEPCT